MSKRESAILAVKDALQSLNTFDVQRNVSIPTSSLLNGLVIVRDGDTGEPEVTMSPSEWHYEHAIRLEVFAVGSDLDAALDGLLMQIATCADADKTFSGAVDSSYLSAPESDLTIDSSIRCKAASINLTVFYSTNSPLK